MNLVITFYCGVFFVMCFLADKAVSSSDEKILEDLPHAVCRTPDSWLFLRVNELGKKCNEMAISNSTNAQKTFTIEEFRELLGSFCERQSLVRNCMTETTSNLTICQDEPFLKTFKIYREVMENILDIGCSQNRNKLASLLHGWVDFTRSKVAAKKCTDRYEQMYQDLDRSEIDVSSMLFNLFNELKTLAVCFNKEELTDSFKVDVKFFLEAIIGMMKCINPQDGELVPCSTIDPSSITTPNICDVRTVGTNMSLYDVLEEDSGSCDMEFLRYSDSVLEEKEIRQILVSECRYGLNLPYCYKQSRTVSEVCLNNTEQIQFNLLGEFIKSAYQTACSEGDKRLGDIITELFRRKSPGQDLAVWDCIDVAKSTRNITDNHKSSSKNMRLYHEVETFKDCLVKKLVGHQTSTDALTSLTNDLLKRMKCIHPEEGTTVLCETLVNTA